MKMELRIQNTELSSNEDGTMTVSGYVNKTEQLSETMGATKRFKEKIAKGAFARSINNTEGDIYFLAEHDKKLILSSTRNESLKLIEDETGLYMEATITPTSWGKDYYELINSGIYRNMSFGFRTISDTWKLVESNLYERVITELELLEVSVVKDPAYSQSTISARGIDLVEEPEIRIQENEEQESQLDVQILKLKLSITKQEDEVRRAEETLKILPESLVFESVVKREKDKLSELNEEYRQLKSEEKNMVENRELNTTSSMALSTQVTGIVEKSSVKSSVFERAQKVKMTTEEIRVPIEQNSGDAQFVVEGEDIPEINLTLNNFIDLKQKRVGVAVSLSRKLMYENGTDLSEYSKNLLLRKTEKRLEKSILAGSTENEFNGIVTDEMVVSVEIPANPTVTGLRKLFTSVKNEFVKNSVFYVEEKFFEKVAELKTDDGNYLVKEIAVGNEVVQSIFGRPVEVTDALPLNNPIVFGSIENAYTIGVTSDLTVRPITDDARYALSGKAGFIAEFYGDGAVTNYQAVCKAVVL